MGLDDLQKIENLAERRGLYRAEAYFWVLRALEYTRRHLRRTGHVSGRELCEGGRRLALDDYGPMAYDVFRHWGLNTTEDMGRIVFDLVEAQLLSKEEQDSLEDFRGVFDFERVFREEYPW